MVHHDRIRTGPITLKTDPSAKLRKVTKNLIMCNVKFRARSKIWEWSLACLLLTFPLGKMSAVLYLLSKCQMLSWMFWSCQEYHYHLHPPPTPFPWPKLSFSPWESLWISHLWHTTPKSWPIRSNKFMVHMVC